MVIVMASFPCRWHVTELDIRKTLYMVCHKVIKDRSVDAAILQKRNQGLLLLGNVFMECGCSKEVGMSYILEKVTSANGASGQSSANVDANGNNGTSNVDGEGNTTTAGTTTTGVTTEDSSSNSIPSSSPVSTPASVAATATAPPTSTDETELD